MKTPHLCTLLLALLMLGSCKKDSPVKTNNSPGTPNSFTLKKDGVPYNPNYIIAGIVDEDAISVETYMVYGQPENNTYGLFIRKSITPGTYALEDGESENFSIIHIQDSTAYFGWSDGSLTVLSNDTITKILHCTFDVNLYNDEIDQYPHITEGEMTINY